MKFVQSKRAGCGLNSSNLVAWTTSQASMTRSNKPPLCLKLMADTQPGVQCQCHSTFCRHKTCYASRLQFSRCAPSWWHRAVAAAPSSRCWCHGVGTAARTACARQLQAALESTQFAAGVRVPAARGGTARLQPKQPCHLACSAIASSTWVAWEAHKQPVVQPPSVASLAKCEANRGAAV